MNYQDTDNIAVFPNKAEIKEEAGAWFVRLETGALDKTELNELQGWIQRSDFHRDYLLEIASTWDAMGALKQLSDFFPLPEKEHLHESSPSRWQHLWDKLAGLWRMPVTMGAATAAVVMLALWLAPQQSIDSPDLQTFRTSVGEQATYTLSDGTSVALNTNSQLSVHYSDSRRAITLIRGEANFDVAKNPERPFVVYAGEGMLWAVGTAFNVRHTTSGVDVTVTEGTVKVFSDIREEQDSALSQADTGKASTGIAGGRAPENGPDPLPREALLQAGQAIHYTRVIEAVEPVVEEEMERKLAWHKGALIFRGEKLQQAVDEISRYTDKRIVIADSSLNDLRVGGHYKTDDIDTLLDNLGQGLNIQVQREADLVLFAAHSSL